VVQPEWSSSRPSARFRAKNWLEALSTTARQKCPSTQSRNRHEPIFQIYSEVVQNVAGS
jgi:hypothetical protein